MDDSEGQAERDLSTHWVDNILNWTVRDREDSFLDYDLGEIANRNFQDRHGICAEQEEIYTVWKEEEPVGHRSSKGLSQGSLSPDPEQVSVKM